MGSRRQANQLPAQNRSLNGISKEMGWLGRRLTTAQIDDVHSTPSFGCTRSIETLIRPDISGRLMEVVTCKCYLISTWDITNWQLQGFSFQIVMGGDQRAGKFESQVQATWSLELPGVSIGPQFSYRWQPPRVNSPLPRAKTRLGLF